MALLSEGKVKNGILKCNRVRERRAHWSDWSSDWARGLIARVIGSRRAMDGQSKSSLMSSLTDVAEAKRRCIIVASASGVQQ